MFALTAMSSIFRYNAGAQMYIFLKLCVAAYPL